MLPTIHEFWLYPKVAAGIPYMSAKIRAIEPLLSEMWTLRKVPLSGKVMVPLVLRRWKGSYHELDTMVPLTLPQEWCRQVDHAVRQDSKMEVAFLLNQ